MGVYGAWLVHKTMVRVAFIHPDLGIGGAERLIVDAALALTSRGHSVEIFTAHHDPGHCFRETSDGSLSVHCAGDWLPRHFCHKGYALFAYLRIIYVAFHLVFFSKIKFDVVICDQVSACIPVLKWGGAKIIFYCHFPDQLLTKRTTWLKKVYRRPIDWLEEKTTGQADVVLVNSNFTTGVFRSTFTSLNSVDPSVLYPSLNFSAFDCTPIELSGVISETATTVFLSINRYERKKNLTLAVEAFAKLLQSLDLEGEQRDKVQLIMAGGYDKRVIENKEYHEELRDLAESMGVLDRVTFLCSFSDAEKVALLQKCTALIYTPSNEHFGICPLEGMYMRKPVIAVNSGGPLETVLHGRTGFLCEPTPEAFAEKMLYFVQHSTVGESMGNIARQHVIRNFSFDSFTEKLDTIVNGVVGAAVKS